MDSSILLKKIKTTRLIKELSQGEMAKRLHISTPTYSRFERGITKTNVELLQNVSQILELDFFNHLEDKKLMILNEDFAVYETKSTDIKKQLQSLIKLMEKQQDLNLLIIEKLKALITE